MPKSKLLQKFGEDLKRAIMERNQTVTSTLRVLIAEIRNEEIAKKKKGKLTDEEIQGVIQRSVKKHKDSIEAFAKGKREDLVKKEKAELGILMEYLPKQLSKEEIEKIVARAIKKTGAKDVSDLGKIMGQVMPQVKGRAEGKLVSDIVKQQLSKI